MKEDNSKFDEKGRLKKPTTVSTTERPPGKKQRHIPYDEDKRRILGWLVNNHHIQGYSGTYIAKECDMAYHRVNNILKILIKDGKVSHPSPHAYRASDSVLQEMLITETDGGFGQSLKRSVKPSVDSNVTKNTDNRLYMIEFEKRRLLIDLKKVSYVGPITSIDGTYVFDMVVDSCHITIESLTKGALVFLLTRLYSKLWVGD